jgi:hypothetical protein
MNSMARESAMWIASGYPATSPRRSNWRLSATEEIRIGMLERKADPFRIALLDLGVEHQKETRRWLQERLKE